MQDDAGQWAGTKRKKCTRYRSVTCEGWSVEAAIITRGGTDIRLIAGQEHTPVCGTLGPVENLEPVEVAARLQQRQIAEEGLGVTVPELDHRIGPHHPLCIETVDVDRHAAKRMGPLDHCGEVVRVRHRDASESTKVLHGGNGCIIEKRHAVPEEVPEVWLSAVLLVATGAGMMVQMAAVNTLV